MANDTIFHPYEVVQQGRNTLELQMRNRSRKLIRWIFLTPPLLIFMAGIVLFLVKKDILYVYVLGGIGILELILFSFFKTPVSVKMDNMGLSLTTLTVKGEKESFYLWNDVDYIRHRLSVTQNNTLLVYDAVLKSGKKIRFLNFSNYQKKKNAIPAMNEVLAQISGKEVTDKR